MGHPKICFALMGAFLAIATGITFIKGRTHDQDTPLLDPQRAQHTQEPTRPTRPPAQKLRYKAKAARPFLALYQEQPDNDPPQTPPKATAHTASQQQPTQAFFSAYNLDQDPNKTFFLAKNTFPQPLQEGKPITLTLQEHIPELQLAKGALLSGSPAFQGQRVKINLTAARSSSGNRPIALACFDPKDLLEGIYLELTAQELEHELQDAALQELWDIAPNATQNARKAYRIAQKARRYTLEKGREVLVQIQP